MNREAFEYHAERVLEYLREQRRIINDGIVALEELRPMVCVVDVSKAPTLRRVIDGDASG